MDKGKRANIPNDYSSLTVAERYLYAAMMQHLILGTPWPKPDCQCCTNARLSLVKDEIHTGKEVEK